MPFKKIDCDFKYIIPYLFNVNYINPNDNGINMPTEEYIKEFLYALMGQKFNIASSIDELNDNTNHLLIKQDEKNYYYFKSRVNRWDFIWEHLHFEIKTATKL